MHTEVRQQNIFAEVSELERKRVITPKGVIKAPWNSPGI